MGKVDSFQTGKFDMSDSFQDWSCSSACSPPSHCHLPRCTKIPFLEKFSGPGKVSFLVSLKAHTLRIYYGMQVITQSVRVLRNGDQNVVKYDLSQYGIDSQPGFIKETSQSVQLLLHISSITHYSLFIVLKIRVLVSLSHGGKFSSVHSPAALWINSISKRGFEVCAREAGAGSNGTGIINWVAFQDQPQVTSGSRAFGGMWTTEAKCDKVAFKKVRRQ